MDVFATMICPVTNVAACRAAQSGASFSCRLADSDAPAVVTGHVSSGWMPQADVDAVAGLCSTVTVTAEPHDPHAILAAAGKVIYSPPR